MAKPRLSPRRGLKQYQDRPRLHLPDIVDMDLRERANAAVLRTLPEGRSHEEPALDALQPSLDGRFKRYGLTILAAGAYGVACKLLAAAPAGLLDELWDAMQSRVGVHVKRSSGRALIVKFVPIEGKDDLVTALREARMHSYLSTASVPETAQMPAVLGAEVVPEFHFGGAITLDSTPTAPPLWFVSVMALAPGKALQSHLKSNALTAALFAKIEKAVYSLWLLGVAHADLHDANLMYDSKTRKVTIIDLGFAVKIPGNMVKKLRVTARPDNDAADVYLLIQQYVSSVVYLRDPTLTFFNPEGRVLRWLYDNVKDKGAIEKARERVWAP